MKIVSGSGAVALGRLERAADDYRLFAGAYARWFASLGYYPLMFDAVAPHLAFAEITRASSDPSVMRILYRRTPRSRYNWVGDLATSPLSSRRATVSFVVFEPWRRLGLGSSAIRLTAGLLAQRGFRTLCVGVEPENRASLRLFRKLGFIDHGIAKRSRHGWVARGAHYLALALSPEHVRDAGS